MQDCGRENEPVRDRRRRGRRSAVPSWHRASAPAQALTACLYFRSSGNEFGHFCGRVRESDLFCLAIAPRAQFDGAFLKALRANGHAQRNTDHIGIFEFDSRSLVAVIKQYVNSTLLQITV